MANVDFSLVYNFVYLYEYFMDTYNDYLNLCGEVRNKYNLNGSCDVQRQLSLECTKKVNDLISMSDNNLKEDLRLTIEKMEKDNKKLLKYCKNNELHEKFTKDDGFVSIEVIYINMRALVDLREEIDVYNRKKMVSKIFSKNPLKQSNLDDYLSVYFQNSGVIENFIKVYEGEIRDARMSVMSIGDEIEIAPGVTVINGVNREKDELVALRDNLIGSNDSEYVHQKTA